MNFLEKLLSESGETSCMRLMSLISLLVGAAIAFISMFKDCSLPNAVPAISIFVGAAFGGKVWQKYAEGNKKGSVRDDD